MFILPNVHVHFEERNKGAETQHLHVPLQGRPELLHSVKSQLRFAKIQGCRLVS